jgi:hypothetical protein
LLRCVAGLMSGPRSRSPTYRRIHNG